MPAVRWSCRSSRSRRSANSAWRRWYSAGRAAQLGALPAVEQLIDPLKAPLELLFVAGECRAEFRFHGLDPTGKFMAKPFPHDGQGLPDPIPQRGQLPVDDALRPLLLGRPIASYGLF